MSTSLKLIIDEKKEELSKLLQLCDYNLQDKQVQQKSQELDALIVKSQKQCFC